MFELIPWKKREEEFPPAISSFRREFEDLFSRFFEGQPLPSVFSKAFSPAVDFSETEREFIVSVEIPGVDPKCLEISISGSRLTIKGEKEEEKELGGKNYHRVERSFGSFSRSFDMPCEVQEDKIRATYENGVLSLRIPKTEKAKQATMKIELN